MSEPSPPWPVKPVVSLLTVCRELAPRALARMSEHLGPPDMVSPWWPFQHTDYYVPEMGAGLERCLASFLHLADPEFLSHWKHVTHRLEQTLSLGATAPQPGCGLPHRGAPGAGHRQEFPAPPVFGPWDLW